VQIFNCCSRKAGIIFCGGNFEVLCPIGSTHLTDHCEIWHQFRRLHRAKFGVYRSILGDFRPQKNTKSYEIFKLYRLIWATSLLDFSEIYVIYAKFPSKNFRSPQAPKVLVRSKKFGGAKWYYDVLCLHAKFGVN